VDFAFPARGAWGRGLWQLGATGSAGFFLPRARNGGAARVERICESKSDPCCPGGVWTVDGGRDLVTRHAFCCSLISVSRPRLDPKTSVFGTVALLFLCSKYCPIID